MYMYYINTLTLSLPTPSYLAIHPGLFSLPFPITCIYHRVRQLHECVYATCT